MELDKTTKHKIRTAFFVEYMDKGAAEMTGLPKKVLDFTDKLGNQMKTWEQENSWKGPVASFLAVVGGAGALIAGISFVPVLSFGVLAGLALTAAVTANELRNTTEALLDRDIANGTLVTRYNTEILPKETPVPAPAAAKLPEAGAAAAGFTAAVTPETTAPAAPVKTIAPAAPAA